jgi:hypothetical protein
MKPDYKRGRENSRSKFGKWTCNQQLIRQIIVKARQQAWWNKNM